MSSVAASFRFAPKDHTFWTNGEQVCGSVELSSRRPAIIRFVQVSLVCEEWVHTGSLEFKEHCRRSSRVWPEGPPGGMELDSDRPAALPFQITIPPQKHPKRLPPSFSLRYNNISWCVKAVVVSSDPGSAELHSFEIEQPLRICTRSDKTGDAAAALEPLALDEYSYCVTRRDFLPVRVGPGPDNLPAVIPCSRSELHTIPDFAVQFRLRVPQAGLLQHQGQATPIYLEAILKNIARLEITELALSIIESADTYYKDPILTTRPIKTLTNYVVHQGHNQFDTQIEASKLCGLSEDFKTEWQNITHLLKLSFLCHVPDSKTHCTLKWEVPVRMLSEAESICYV